MEKQYNLLIDTKKTGFNTIRGLKQGDNNSVLNITLVQNSVPFDLENCTVRINYKRQDSKIFLQMADITNAVEGNIKINVLTQVLENVGEVKADLSIFDSNNRKITSATFSIFVDASIYRNDYIETADLDLIQSIWVQEDARIKQENTRQKNEENREIAETKRQQTFDNNEAERQKVFDFTEGERIKNEKDRQLNEENRQQREITRENNEEIRKNEEGCRTRNENVRIENENVRIKNEVVRENNETIRKSEFNGIKKEFGDLKSVAMDENAVLNLQKQIDESKQQVENNFIKSINNVKPVNGEVDLKSENILVDEFENLEQEIGSYWMINNRHLLDTVVSRHDSPCLFGFINELDKNKLELEKGAWTPVLYGSIVEGNNDYEFQIGEYIKIGRIIFVSFIVWLRQKDETMSGKVSIKGLPFAIRGIEYPVVFSRLDNIDIQDFNFIIGSTTATNILLNKVKSNNKSEQIMAENIKNNSAIVGSAIYKIGL